MHTLKQHNKPVEAVDFARTNDSAQVQKSYGLLDPTASEWKEAFRVISDLLRRVVSPEAPRHTSPEERSSPVSSQDNPYVLLQCLTDWVAWRSDALPSAYGMLQAVEVLRSAIRSVSRRAAASRGISIELWVEGQDKFAHWDVFKLDKLCYHLLCAAVEATPSGASILVYAARVPASAELPDTKTFTLQGLEDFQITIVYGAESNPLPAMPVVQPLSEKHESIALCRALLGTLGGNLEASAANAVRPSWRLRLPVHPGAGNLKADHNEHRGMNTIDAEWLERLYNTIKEEIENAELSIDKLARKMASSRSQLHRKLKMLTGLGPQELLRNYRLDLALQLLREGAGNVNEVSERVGFINAKHFSTVFKKRFGFSPGAV